ncbi:MAG: aminotransferase class V-fold PLP-dependent enzyme [Oligoflexales bacterium]
MMDIEKHRLETPGSAHITHFNNAGASLMAKVVVDTMKNFIDLETRMGGYEAEASRSEDIDRVYASIARLIRANPDEIAITGNATQAWNAFFYSMRFEKDDEIITTISEYGSNYIALLQVAKKTGARIVNVRCDEDGMVSLDHLKKAFSKKTKLIAITHVPTNCGLIQPVAEVGKLARKAKVPFLLDACQSVGQLDIDVNAIGCDALTATGRKYLRGPRGTGFLYVNRRIVEKIEPSFLDNHSAKLVSLTEFAVRPDARRFETWECSHTLKLGLGAAVDYLLTIGTKAVEERVRYLAAKLIRSLSEHSKIMVHNVGSNQCGIVSFSVEGTDVAAIRRSLSGANFNVSITTPENTPLDLIHKQKGPLLRASLHYYNTEAEIEAFVKHLAGKH